MKRLSRNRIQSDIKTLQGWMQEFRQMGMTMPEGKALERQKVMDQLMLRKAQLGEAK